MPATPPDPELATLWERLGPITPAGPSPEGEAVARRIQARAEELEAAGNPEAAVHLSALLFRRGVYAAIAGQFAAAEAAYRAAVPHAVRAVAADPADVERRDRLGSLHYNLGLCYSATGRPAEAEPAYRAALPHQESNARDNPDRPHLRSHLAQTRFNLGNTCMDLRRGAEAADWFRSARELWLRLVDELPAESGHAHDLARSDFNLAYVLSADGPTPDAVAAYHRAQEVWERLLRDFGEDVERRCDLARCYYNYALLLARSGRPAEAVAAVARSLPHFDRLVEVAPDRQDLAALRAQARDQHDAWVESGSPERVAARLAADADRRAAAPRAAGDWKRLRQLGAGLIDHARGFHRDNRPLEMEHVYRTATGLIAEAARHDPTPDSAHLEAAVWFDLNIDLRALGLYDGAEEAVQNAFHRWQTLHALHPTDRRFLHWLAGAHNNLGIIHAETGRVAAAEAAYREALALREAAHRANPDDAENQLFLGGALCNLGNAHLARGLLTAAREFYARAVGSIEPVRDRLTGNPLVGQFLANCRDGLVQCAARPPLDPDRFANATLAWSPPGPPPLTFDTADAGLSAALRAADALRLAGAPAADGATAELVSAAPGCAEAWVLRGLVLGGFGTEAGGEQVRWEDSRHQEATAAFYQALVRRPGYYEAKLYKGLALAQAAKAAQAGIRATAAAVEQLPAPERDGWLAPRRLRFRYDVNRAKESLEAAARLRPGNGRAWYELAALYRGVGDTHVARPYLDQLRAVDPVWWEQAREESGPEPGAAVD